MNVEQAIQIIIKNHGIEILSSPKRFQSMVMDYAKEYDQEIQLFKICCQRGILDFAKEIICIKDENKIENTAKKFKDRLEHESFISEKYAVDGINMILQGIGVKYKLSTECVDEKKSQKNVRYVSDLMVSSVNFDKKINIDEKKFQDLLALAEIGDENAMIAIGDFYRNGIIVKKNWRMAEYYYRIAAKLGNEEAKYKHNAIISEHK